MYRRFFKRVLDVSIAVLALLLLSPVMLAVALLIYLEDRGSVFFRQIRVGAGGREFEFVKFRSMPEGTRSVPSTEAGSIPVTRVGRFIRRTNIDELPQLFAVIRGEMSLVGPRPALPKQDALCAIRRQNGSIDCVPGMTGLAQVNAYDGMPEEEKAEYDGEYARSLSLMTDLRVILRTFGYLTRKPPVY
jgi:O-antigen biosynthesis protein WbqP